MIPLWILLSLCGVFFAVGGALFDKYLLEKYFGDDSDAGPGALLIFSAYFLIIVVVGVFIFKYSAIDFSLEVGLVGMLVGAINGLWILLYLLAINTTDVSRVMPIFQTVPLFGLILGMIFLGEYLTWSQFFAGSIIVIGAVFLLLEHNPSGRYTGLRTVKLALLSAFFVAISHVLFKIVALDTNFWTATFWLGSGFVLFGVGLYNFVASYRQQFESLFEQKIRNVFGANAINEFFDNAGELTFFAAIVLGPVALVQSLNAYEPLLIFLAGVTIAKIQPGLITESSSRGALIHKLFGISVVLIGSLMLYSVI